MLKPIPTVVDRPDRIKLSLTFEAGPLQQDLVRLQAGDWIDHFVAQKYDRETDCRCGNCSAV